MYSLDQVIECLSDPTEHLSCIMISKKTWHDALHYLREYRSDKAMWEADRKGFLNWIEQYKESREKHQQAVIELKKNPPLTWEQLKQMEGKPVWVENQFYKRWLIAYKVNREDIIFDGNGFNTQAFSVDYGTVWQAYRKER